MLVSLSLGLAKPSDAAASHYGGPAVRVSDLPGV